MSCLFPRSPFCFLMYGSLQQIPSTIPKFRNIVVKQPVGTAHFTGVFLWPPLHAFLQVSCTSPQRNSHAHVTLTTSVPQLDLTPWNFPSAMITPKLGAGLEAGCTGAIKLPPQAFLCVRARRRARPRIAFHVAGLTS